MNPMRCPAATFSGPTCSASTSTASSPGCDQRASALPPPTNSEVAVGRCLYRHRTRRPIGLCSARPRRTMRVRLSRQDADRVVCMTVARARHEHVAGVLRQRITRRDYAIGQPLPPESALCAEFEVSRGPVRQALATLKNEGLIKVSRGKPAVVRSHDATQTLDTFTPFTQWARRNDRTPGSRTLEIARRRAREPATVALGLTPDDFVVEVLRVRLLDGEPRML